jgi:hypothetical protein
MSNKQIEEIRNIQKFKYQKMLEQKQKHEPEPEPEPDQDKKPVHESDVELKQYQEYLDKNDSIKDSYTECLCPENTYPINQSDINSELFVIIFSIFEDIPIEYVQKEIIDHFYNQINNSDLDDLYTFYISIKEISSTYDVIDIEIIFNTLNLIKMNYDFVKILDNKDKLEYIKIIFQEFIKIIDNIKPEFNLK